MSLGPKSLRTTGLIKKINQKKRRETIDTRRFINHTIYSVLREPRLDLLLIRECLTGRLSEDLISLLTWGGVRRGVWGEHRDFHRHMRLTPCNFLPLTGAAEKALSKNNARDEHSTATGTLLHDSLILDIISRVIRLFFPYHNNLERLRKTEVFYSQLTDRETKTVSGFHPEARRWCWGRLWNLRNLLPSTGLYLLGLRLSNCCFSTRNFFF